MYKIIFFFFAIIAASQAQSNDSTSSVLLLNEEYLCPFSRLDKISREKTDWVWTVYPNSHREFQLKTFGYLKQHIRVKTKYSNIFDESLCVQLATIHPKGDSLKQTYIELYEIGFEFEYQCESFMKTIKKYSITKYDNIDVSLPLKFYSTGKSIYIFLDAEEPNASVFDQNVEKMCKILDNTR